MKDNNLFRFLRVSPLRNIPLYHRLRFAMKEKKMRLTVTRKGEDFDIIRPLLLESMVKYHWDTDEFFIYHYKDLTPEQRKSFVPEYEKNIFCCRVNNYKSSRVFKSKWQTYQKFKLFYGRDCCLVSDALVESRDGALLSFLSKHSDFIIKPDSGSLGKGVSIIHSANPDDALDAIIAYTRGKKGLFVVEELIRQSPGLGIFHPSSVNTIRLRTFRFDDRVEILPSNLRLGSGGSIVDNTGRGGISAFLDKDGVVIAACDNNGTHFEVHPDSGIQIMGFQVPGWKEAVTLAERLCQVVPDVRYVGWDLALTEKGWVVIEGNDNSMFEGIQMPLQKGFRSDLDRILSEMGLKL